MEYRLNCLKVKSENNKKQDGVDSSHDIDKREILETPSNLEQHGQVDDWRHMEGVTQGAPEIMHNSGEVNMEASITPEDVLRAGGLGARDDISSVVPVASDSTDFEDTIIEAQGYEESEKQIHRPGLGWTEATDQKKQEK